MRDAHDRASCGAHDPRGHVQQSVAQLLRFCEGQFAVQKQGFCPGEQVDAGQGEFEPRLVDGELAGREPAEARVLSGADAVLDPGVGPVA